MKSVHNNEVSTTKEVKSLKGKRHLIATHYFPQRRDSDDKIIYIYRDAETGEKGFEVVEDPTITYYITTGDNYLEHPLTYVPIENAVKVESLNRYLLYDMAKMLGPEAEQFLNECITNRKFYYANRLHLNNNLHGSDVNVVDHHIDKFIETYGEPPTNLTKGYFDIETDIMFYDGFPDPEEAPAPINIITYFDDATMSFYTYGLIDEENESLMSFLENELENTMDEIIQEIKEEDGLDVKFAEVKFFDSELDVITSFFNAVNDCKPDFCGAWNMEFDALTMINRLKNEFNISNPETIMTPPDIPYKNAHYYSDKRARDIKDKGDTFTTTGYTNWIDQMILYANLRAAGSAKSSYKLDDIAFEELGKNKVKMGKNETIRNLPWVDYKKFFKYNVKDVFLLYLIEESVGDIDIIYTLSMMTRTRVDKTMRKTISLRNYANLFFRNHGLVMSNNRNLTYGGDRESDESFRGAYVSDPNKNSNVGVPILGVLSRYLFRKAIDVDLSSIYPNLIIAFNIDPSTQVGKVRYFKYNDESDTYDELTSYFIDAIHSQDWIGIGTDYLNLPTPIDMLDGLDEFLAGNE